MNNGRRSKRWSIWHRRRLYNQSIRGFGIWSQYLLTGNPFVSQYLNHIVQRINKRYGSVAVLERTYHETAYGKIPDMCYEMIDGVITPIK